jgi:hypothetical protein
MINFSPDQFHQKALNANLSCAVRLLSETMESATSMDVSFSAVKHFQIILSPWSQCR